MDEKPILSDLSFDDLDSLNNVVFRLLDAGRVVTDGGLIPRFSLVPGQRATMVIDFTMPTIWWPVPDAQTADQVDPEVSDIVGADLSAMLAADDVTLARIIGERRIEDYHKAGMAEYYAARKLDDPADDLSDDPLPTAGPLGIGLAPAPTSYPGMAEPVADPLPAGAFVDNTPDRPAPTSQPGSASAMAAAAKALAWSEDEDALAVKIYATSIQAGLSITAAGRKVSEALGRPLSGTSHRLRNKLADPIKDELQRLKPKLEHVDAPAEAHPIDPRLRRHLSAMSSITHGKRWKEDEDLTLLEAAVNGLKVGEIAADMGLDTGKVKHRLETLCGSFTPGDVLQGLRQNAGQS